MYSNRESLCMCISEKSERQFLALRNLRDSLHQLTLITNYENISSPLPTPYFQTSSQLLKHDFVIRYKLINS